MHDNHPHITYAEIEKYVETGDDAFLLSDLDFYEEFEKRLHCCAVCRDRFDLYSFTSSLVLISGEQPESQAVSWIAGFLERLRNAGEIFFGSFTLTPPPVLATRGGGDKAEGGLIISVTQKDGSDTSTDNIIVNADDEYFKFELFEPVKLRFTMPEPELNKKCNDYRFFVCREEDGVESCYPLKKTLKNRMAAITEILPAGKYVGAVIGVN